VPGGKCSFGAQMEVCMIWSCRNRQLRAPLPSIAIHVLDQVEYRDPVTNRREQTCSVWCEQQVSSAVNGPKQVGKLAHVSRVTVHSTREAHLEVCLHGGALCSKCYRRIIVHLELF
jgi:hypothetical protein